MSTRIGGRSPLKIFQVPSLVLSSGLMVDDAEPRITSRIRTATTGPVPDRIRDLPRLESLRPGSHGVCFPPDVIRDGLEAETRLKADRCSGIYMAAVVEYAAREVCDLAGDSARARGTPRIGCKDLRLVLRGDSELNQLTKHAIIPLQHALGDDGVDFLVNDD